MAGQSTQVGSVVQKVIISVEFHVTYDNSMLLMFNAMGLRQGVRAGLGNSAHEGAVGVLLLVLVKAALCFLYVRTLTLDGWLRNNKSYPLRPTKSYIWVTRFFWKGTPLMFLISLVGP